MTTAAACPCCGAEVTVRTWIERQGDNPFVHHFTDGEIVDQDCRCSLAEWEKEALVIDVIARVEAGDSEPDWESE